MKSYETVEIRLTADDIFELKLLRDRAEKESRDCKLTGQERCSHQIYTDTSREALHASETLNRILKQV